MKYFNGQRGYVRCEITPKLWRSDYRIVEQVTVPNGAIHTDSSFVVEDGQAGTKRV